MISFFVSSRGFFRETVAVYDYTTGGYAHVDLPAGAIATLVSK